MQKLCEYPDVVHLNYQPWPDGEGLEVEFRLIYKGSLPAQGAGTGGSRIEEKHAIRRRLHPQLRELWTRHHFLKRYTIERPYTRDLVVPEQAGQSNNVLPQLELERAFFR